MPEPEKTSDNTEQPPESDAAAPGVDAAANGEVAESAQPAEVESTQHEPAAAESMELESAESESTEPESAEAGSAEAESTEPAGRKKPKTTSSGPIEELEEEDEAIEMDWYILKVQSNRENTICDALRRRVAVAGLDKYFGEVMVPTEDVAEFKNGKKKIVKRKLYPGYIVAHMAINDDTWFLVRETPGIGDFTGSQGKPSPMLKHEVDRIVKSANPDDEDGEQVKTAIPFKLGEGVRIKEGTFENFEGVVEGIDEANGRVTVMISIFGRSTPFEAEHWQIEAI